MNDTFDAILSEAQAEEAAQEAQQATDTYDKAAYKERKQKERADCYRLADVTAEKAASSTETFTAYLNVQARFNRYSVTNALLLTAQYPSATRLASFKNWQKKNAKIMTGSKAILLLSPGKEFVREDGSIGAHFNVRKVFDISQTDAVPHQAEIHRDEKLLAKALIHNAPCKLAFDDDLLSGATALYKPEQKTVYVRHGLNGAEAFRALARELAFAHLDKGGDFSRSKNEFKAKSIAFLVCARNRIAPDTVSVPSSYANQEARALKTALEEIREIANTMHDNMEQVFSKQRREQTPQQDKKPRTGEAR